MNKKWLISLSSILGCFGLCGLFAASSFLNNNKVEAIESKAEPVSQSFELYRDGINQIDIGSFQYGSVTYNYTTETYGSFVYTRQYSTNEVGYLYDFNFTFNFVINNNQYEVKMVDFSNNQSLVDIHCNSILYTDLVTDCSLRGTGGYYGNQDGSISFYLRVPGNDAISCSYIFTKVIKLSGNSSVSEEVLNYFFLNVDFAYAVINFDLQQNNMYQIGYDDGYLNGYNNGSWEGYQSGLGVGYNQGYSQATSDLTDQYNQQVGNSYADGYSAGYSDGSNEDATVTSIFGGIATVAMVPINFFLSIFNFEILGVNIASVVSALLSICVIIIVWRLVMGGKGDD